MKRSAWEAWTAQASRLGIPKPQEFLRDVTEKLALGFQAEADFEASERTLREVVNASPEQIAELRDAATKLQPTAQAQSLHRSQVSPRFKKDGK
jgi:hypothetical protein